MSTKIAMCQLGWVSLGHVWILPQNKNKNKQTNKTKESSGVFFHGVTSRGLKEQSCLAASTGMEVKSDFTAWFENIHFFIQTTLPSSLFSKQAVFTQTTTSQADRSAHVAIGEGRVLRQKTANDPLSVMSLDQLHCDCLRGTRSS